MGKYTQDHRPLAVSTPLGKDALLLEKLSGREALSEIFRFRLDMLAEQAVSFDRLVGQKVTVTLAPMAGVKRYLNGIVRQLGQGPQVRSAQGDVTFFRYRADVVPELWLLTKKVQSRIFQHLSVPDILKTVLDGLDVSFALQATYNLRDFCVQYEESDFAFASRLMAEEGIFYYFQHHDNGHTLVLSDSSASCPDLAAPNPVIYEVVEGGPRPEPRISAWEKRQRLRAQKFTLWDYCFELPEQHLAAELGILEGVSAGEVSHNLKAGAAASLEVYHGFGGYAKRFDGIDKGGGAQAADLQKIFQDNQHAAKVLMEREAAAAVAVTGASNCGHFVPGALFTLQRHFNADGPYLLTRVEHEASIAGTYTNATAPPLACRNTFRCIPKALPYRPKKKVSKPRLPGLQTATVVGPAGEEVFTDKYGRVKVQFHWDRQGQLNADSSCWVRVAQPWAGQTWGAVTLPRVGQEVVVGFELDDPDQPLVLGSVYNSKQMPPYPLPAQRLRSGFVSSTEGGGMSNFHEFRMDDTSGSETVFVHSENHMHHSAESSMFYLTGWGQDGSGEGGGCAGPEVGSGAGGGDFGNPSWFGATKGTSYDCTWGSDSGIVFGDNVEIVFGENLEVVGGINGDFIVGANIETVIGFNLEVFIGPNVELFIGPTLEWIYGDVFEKVNGNFTEVINGSFYEIINNGDLLTVVNGWVTEWIKGSETPRLDPTALSAASSGISGFAFGGATGSAAVMAAAFQQADIGAAMTASQAVNAASGLSSQNPIEHEEIYKDVSFLSYEDVNMLSKNGDIYITALGTGKKIVIQADEVEIRGKTVTAYYEAGQNNQGFVADPEPQMTEQLRANKAVAELELDFVTESAKVQALEAKNAVQFIENGTIWKVFTGLMIVLTLAILGLAAWAQESAKSGKE